MNGRVFIFLCIILIGSVGLLIICAKPMKYKEPSLSSNLSKEQEIKTKKLIKGIVLFFKFFKLLIFIAVMYSVIIPFLQDVPAIMRGNYTKINGTVIQKSSDYKRSRTLGLKEKETGKVYTIRNLGKDAKVGEDVTIVFLKHLKIGSIE